jgi:hypothetical protein
VIFGALVRQARGEATHMPLASALSEAWLPQLCADCPLLAWSAPLSTPIPAYDRQEDRVVAYATPTFGVHAWSLAPVRRPLAELLAFRRGGGEGAAGLDVTDGSNSSSSNPSTSKSVEADVMLELGWFARCLLEGSVLPELGGTLGQALLRESCAPLSEPRGGHGASSARCVALLAALGHSSGTKGGRGGKHGGDAAAAAAAGETVVSAAALRAKLARSPTAVTDAMVTAPCGDGAHTAFLMAELQAWLLPEARKRFRHAWAALQVSAREELARGGRLGGEGPGGEGKKKKNKKKKSKKDKDKDEGRR